MKAIYLCCTFMCYNIYFSEIANVFLFIFVGYKRNCKKMKYKRAYRRPSILNYCCIANQRLFKILYNTIPPYLGYIYNNSHIYAS